MLRQDWLIGMLCMLRIRFDFRQAEVFGQHSGYVGGWKGMFLFFRCGR
jgi:hypothetical protein